MSAFNAVICLDNANNDEYNIDKNDLGQPVTASVNDLFTTTADSIFSLFYCIDKFLYDDFSSLIDFL